jgi:2'-5' RNA ligase
LAEIAAEVEQRLEKLGCEREKRAFKPHLTLARFKSEEGVAELHAVLAKMGAAEFGATRTGEMHLYQSVLKPGGAEYTKLGTFRFAGGVR